MQTITLETTIAAPPERCFLLSLSIDLHMESTAQTSERAVAGVTHGMIGLGETVTWRGRHFGFMLEQETLIDQCDKPLHFRDVMVRGVFKSFEHDHYFEELEQGCTRMRDVLRFVAPLGPLGLLAETLVLRHYLARFLQQRNELIKRVAEGPREVWSRYTQT